MTVHTCTLEGVNAYTARITTDDSNWAMDFLPDAAKREARVRVRSALEYIGEDTNSWGFSLHTIEYAEDLTKTFRPLGVRCSTVHLDLPMAVALLARILNVSIPEGWAFAGELSLGGDLRPFRGAAPMARRLKAEGFKCFVVPEDNASEVEATGIAAWGFKNLGDLKGLLLDPPDEVHTGFTVGIEEPRYSCDFSEISVDVDAEWPFAVEVALAGGHSLLLRGAPGSGKTMIARRMCTCLELDEKTRDEATDLYSITGLLHDTQRVSVPFRAPHHTISDVGMYGSHHSKRPGEVSLAHGGVLFLDEAPEFRKHVQEVVTNVYKKKHTGDFHADFMLVGSVNDCPCGRFGTDRACSCTSDMRDRYLSRVEGFDFDISVPVRPVSYKDIANADKAEPSRAIRERVMAARQRQMERQGCLNSRREFPNVGGIAQTLMQIAQTIADLHQPNGPADEAGEITVEHITLALGLIDR